MSEPLFDIVFRGDIVMGHTIQDVKTRLGQLFKIDAAKVEALFAGGAVPLKRNIDMATAEKYKAVLTQAGAQIQIRAADGNAKAKTAPRRREQSQSAPPRSVSDVKNQSVTAADGFSLAPVGSYLLSPSEVRPVPQLDVDLSGISVKPMEGDLLNESEKAKPVDPEIAISDYELAAVGTALLEGFEREALPLPEIEVNFEIAEVGADLLGAADRPAKPFVEVDVSHLNVLPLKEQ